MSVLVLVLVLLLDLGSPAEETTLSCSTSTLCRHGFEFSLDSTTDSFLVSGYSRPAGTAETWLDLSGDLQLGRLRKGLERTRAFFSLHINGNWNSGPGEAAQTISGIQSQAGFRVAELWMEHEIRHGIRLRAGKIDGNRDFAYIENATSFVNAAEGYTPSFFLLPNYNATQPGAEFLMESGRVRLNVAAFRKSQGTGLLLAEEGGAHWNLNNHSGRIALGTWQSTGADQALDNTLQRGDCGAYIVAEQTLWHAKSTRQSWRAFLQWGTAPSRFSTFSRHTGGGVLWSSLLRSRQDDAVGLSVSRGEIGALVLGESPQRETVWETFYRAQLSPRMSISPDLQYIANPGGKRQSLLAIGARVTINLSPHRD